MSMFETEILGDRAGTRQSNPYTFWHGYCLDEFLDVAFQWMPPSRLKGFPRKCSSESSGIRGRSAPPFL